MSESNAICPRCQRAPGQAHPDDCPRSRLAQRRRRIKCALALDPRMLWISANLHPTPEGKWKTVPIMGTYRKEYGELTRKVNHAGRFLRAVQAAMQKDD